MGAQILASVVVCTYRRPDTLPKVIESLLVQTLPEDQFEIIIVDNNSKDQTEKIVQRFVQNNPGRIRYVLEPRQGLSFSRNRGVDASAGEVLAFIDDDAVADPDWLKILLGGFQDQEVWAVGGKVLPVWLGVRPPWLEDSLLRNLSIVDWGDRERHLIWPERLIGTNISFRKDVFTSIGLFDILLGRKGTALLGNEDTEIQERIHHLKRIVLYIPEATVHHFVSAERLSKKYFYRRAFGTGRTETIRLFQDRHRRKPPGLLLRHMRSLFKDILFCYEYLWDESQRFYRIMDICLKFGALYQSIISVKNKISMSGLQK